MNCIRMQLDEPLALDIISEFCSRINYLNLIGSFTNPMDATRLLNSIEVELILINIGIASDQRAEFLKTLYSPPMIIFTTAYKEHAFPGI